MVGNLPCPISLVGGKWLKEEIYYDEYDEYDETSTKYSKKIERNTRRT